MCLIVQVAWKPRYWNAVINQQENNSYVTPIDHSAKIWPFLRWDRREFQRERERERMATAIRQFQPSATGTATLTITIDEASSQPEAASSSSSSSSHQRPRNETLVLTLKPKKKKKVTWKEGTVDNEFLNRKSSKKCCIFHKDKPFDEDYSDDEDENKGHSNDHQRNHDHGGCGNCGDHWLMEIVSVTNLWYSQKWKSFYFFCFYFYFFAEFQRIWNMFV